MVQKNVIIIGAAGRDFHNFNTYFRNNPDYKVVAFTAAQIPDIDDRIYPPSLSGELYPEGIPIHPEDDLPNLIKDLEVDECIFSYSDVSYHHVMAIGAIVQAAGAGYRMLGPNETMIKSTKPLISVCATRTGCGKSQTSRRVIEVLMGAGLKVVAIRHPMPYGNLEVQKVQRFATIEDLKNHDCTIEEMEEYEPHITRGNVIYAGVDYEAILRAAENDPDGCDVIIWDGGNNDFSFYQSDIYIVVTDPHRVGHEMNYFPGEINLRMADIAIINKMDSASGEQISQLKENINRLNPHAVVIEADSEVMVDDPDVIKDKRILAVEDGPTLTHGGMKIGAGVVAGQRFGAVGFVDARPFAVGKIDKTYKIYPDIGTLLPAMGYGEEQLKDLEATINACDCDAVVVGTPIDLSRIINIQKPNTRVYYNLKERGEPNIESALKDFIKENTAKNG